jgi:acylglycerol lipase
VVLAGHSGGGLAAYLLAVRSPGIADALVLSGATLRPLEWVDALLADGGADDEGFDPTAVLSTHPEYVHAMLHDPLVWRGSFPPATLRSITRVMPETAAGLSEGLPGLPVLFVHGEADPLVPVADARASAAQVPHARLVTFPGDLHDVLNEHDRDAVHEVIAAFVTRSAASVPLPA